MDAHNVVFADCERRMNVTERLHARPVRGRELLMSRIAQLRQTSLDDDGSVVRRMQELVDTLAWIRIELAPPAGASTSPNDVIRRQRALTKMDSALDLARQLVFDLDGELQLRGDDGSPKAAAE
jgi:hypothetical protein